jgi:hypothetical protein
VSETIEQRITRLHRHGVIDMHFDLPMDLYDKRARADVLATDFLEDLEAGDIAVAGVALYLEDRYLPEMGLRIALDQIARLYVEVGESDRFAICRSHREICARARKTRSRCFSPWKGWSRSARILICSASFTSSGFARFASPTSGATPRATARFSLPPARRGTA